MRRKIGFDEWLKGRDIGGCSDELLKLAYAIFGQASTPVEVFSRGAIRFAGYVYFDDVVEALAETPCTGIDGGEYSASKG